MGADAWSSLTHPLSGYSARRGMTSGTGYPRDEVVGLSRGTTGVIHDEIDPDIASACPRRGAEEIREKPNDPPRRKREHLTVRRLQFGGSIFAPSVGSSIGVGR